jgi:Glycosyl hydrolases family 16
MAVPGPTVAPGAQLQPAGFASTCIGYCHYPTNAAAVFKWGTIAWRQEFETGTLGSNWVTNGQGTIGQQNGMLTIQAGSSSGTVEVWPTDAGPAQSTGRWEARIRAYERSTTGTQFRFTWELVPVSGDDSCGSDRVVLGTWVPGDARARGFDNTLPDYSFTFSRKRDLRSRAWHTFAVEIAPDHISWFVDTKVMRTETRPKALSGETYRPELVMEATADTTMRPSWFQADWVRYYTLKRPSALPIDAPEMNRTTSTSTC